jgi:hypothetical protein
LNSVSVTDVADLSDDVSDGSNAGHDMSFRLLTGFIPHQQVYYIMCTHTNARS